MLTGIDHVIIASAEPEADAALLEEAIGLRASGGGRHDAHGTYNRLFWLGDSYVELMGVFDAPLAERSWWGAHILRRLANGGGYAGAALASDNVAADVDRLRALGAPIAEPVAGERLRPDGNVVRWSIGRLAEPDADFGLMFLIEHDESAAEWSAGDRAARAAEVHPIGTPARLARVELPVADVAATSMRLLRGFGLQFRPSLAGAGARDTSLGTQTLRLTPARGRSSPTVAVRAGHEARHVDLLGCAWDVLPLAG